MSWIQSIGLEQAQGRLRALYERLATAGSLDNIITVHGLRPHTLDGHLALYRAAVHHSANTLPKTYLEAIGVRVSRLNGCRYCVVHHSEGLRRETGDPDLADALLAALAEPSPGAPFTAAEQAGLHYADVLTRTPAQISESDIQRLRDSGLDDGQILEINQVVGYFCYANRVVLGLGVALEADGHGQSHPDPDNDTQGTP
ncbi:MAG: peroxidase-related enzyme [Xanthomonadaceae bacterium]|nr:peroxidase-related enzyme [Xanthomonadaceae bacterium]